MYISTGNKNIIKTTDLAEIEIQEIKVMLSDSELYPYNTSLAYVKWIEHLKVFVGIAEKDKRVVTSTDDVHWKQNLYFSARGYEVTSIAWSPDSHTVVISTIDGSLITSTDTKTWVHNKNTFHSRMAGRLPQVQGRQGGPRPERALPHGLRPGGRPLHHGPGVHGRHHGTAVQARDALRAV